MYYFLLRAQGFFLTIGWIAGALLHVWTIILAWQLSGFVAAVISTVVLGLAELWWAGFLWWKVGLLNLYTLTFVAVIATFSISDLCARAAEERLIKSIMKR